MFYSQFILAKKGPLGTIWIAAHLERKLRKNQVADTDIGVSVDSILFPEVPIALRLSSHLLLGVVRIYSRKVNYLFDDCSEALLKIKQAFRSAAVDLPPEESTAPYHSITLPETFDLDDFELPDNDIFQGNYVDHHISTREQITLQDTMDGVVYSTLQFGLDERFGDGDTSQVGLDLDEDLFVDKVSASTLEETSGVDPQVSGKPMPHSIGEADFSRMTGSSGAMPVNGTRNKVEGLTADIVDDAQAPSTPILVEEPNLSSVKEGLGCDDQMEADDQNGRDLASFSCHSNLHHGGDGNQMDDDIVVHLPIKENGCLPGGLEMKQAQVQEDAPSTVGTLDGADKLENLNHTAVPNDELSMLSVDQINGECEKSVGTRLEETNDVEITDKLGKLGSHGAYVASIDSGHVDVEAEACIDPESKHVHDELATSNCVGGFNSDKFDPWTSDAAGKTEPIHAAGTSTEVQGKVRGVNDGMECENVESTLYGGLQADGGKGDLQLDGQLDNVNSTDNQCENLNSSVTTDLPAPEKLLSVPQILHGTLDDLLNDSTPDKEVSEGGVGSTAGTKISGKKRSYTESSLTVQSLNSVESFAATKSKRTVDSIPDDDDLLSSILVGRRSALLKLKPTPPAREAASIKRVRSVSRPSSLKRKVLMDDSMVLHGDTIRQQLISTEDIRRLRKKAPCTRAEILMIQTQFLEDEIFHGPVLTGVSSELSCLHSESLDLSRISVSDDGHVSSSSEAANSKELIAGPRETHYSELGGTAEPIIGRDNVGEQPANLPNHTENGNDQDHHVGYYDVDNQDLMNVLVDKPDDRTLEEKPMEELSKMEIDKGNTKVVGQGDCSVDTGLEARSVDLVSRDTGAEASVHVGASDLPSDKTYTQPIEDINVSGDKSNAEGHDEIEFLNNVNSMIALGTEIGAGVEILLQQSKFGVSVESKTESQADGSAPAGDVNSSLTNAASETDGCTNPNYANVEQASEDIEKTEMGMGQKDGGTMSSGHDDKDQASYSCGDSTIHSTRLEHDRDFENPSFNDGDDPVCQEADQQSSMNTVIPSIDHGAIGDCGDLQDAAFPNDTEFLNADDDEVGEEDEDGMPGAEDNRLVENTGWSSRTRAVAMYLQTLFDGGAGNVRKVVSMDNLLAGKTRKEASRMFFETLVLKTRDYVQVEQPKPFGDINIRPRAKLMKSEF